MYSVYAIASKERKYVYVGLSSEVTQRLLRHNKGYERTTSPYAPFVLIYEEEVGDRAAAREREKYLKSRVGKRFLYRLIEEKYPELTQYQKENPGEKCGPV